MGLISAQFGHQLPSWSMMSMGRGCTVNVTLTLLIRCQGQIVHGQGHTRLIRRGHGAVVSDLVVSPGHVTPDRPRDGQPVSSLVRRVLDIELDLGMGQVLSGHSSR